MKEDPMRSQLK